MFYFQRLVFVLFLMIFFLSCSNKLQSDEKIIIENFPTFKLSQYRYLYVIPHDGCGTCIQKSIQFMKDTNNKNVAFLLIDNSKKNINNLLNSTNNKKQVIVDSDLILETFGITISKPILYTIKGNHFVNKEVIEDYNIDEILSNI